MYPAAVIAKVLKRNKKKSKLLNAELIINWSIRNILIMHCNNIMITRFNGLMSLMKLIITMVRFDDTITN